MTATLQVYESRPGLISARNAADAAFLARHPDDPDKLRIGFPPGTGWYQGGYGGGAGQATRDAKMAFALACRCQACAEYVAAWSEGRVDFV